MSMLGRMVGTLRTARNHDLFCECRQCGTTLDPTDLTCPACGSSDLVTYEI
ncbi:C2C2 Zn finger [Natranaeroarchaeum sulfidigenes]|uniref:C2C2 Zn finger n=1 Tax=Natranaeroarchaeum sulfidigenes TaxID=2784880 RepID=A0A897MNZ0_9EURY|nr:C2C2 Zn finger [Natranaeroarchaeum sulfidigenes]